MRQRDELRRKIMLYMVGSYGAIFNLGITVAVGVDLYGAAILLELLGVPVFADLPAAVNKGATIATMVNAQTIRFRRATKHGRLRGNNGFTVSRFEARFQFGIIDRNSKSQYLVAEFV